VAVSRGGACTRVCVCVCVVLVCADRWLINNWHVYYVTHFGVRGILLLRQISCCC